MLDPEILFTDSGLRDYKSLLWLLHRTACEVRDLDNDIRFPVDFVDSLSCIIEMIEGGELERGPFNGEDDVED